MALSKDDILTAISEMSVMEIVELIEAMEEKFGVSAAAAVAAAPAAAAGGDAGAAAEEKTEFDVMLTSAGEKKVNVIKVVRAVTGLGLKEAKGLVDGGSDILCLETATDTLNMKAGLFGVQKLFDEIGKSVPVFSSVTLLQLSSSASLNSTAPGLIVLSSSLQSSSSPQPSRSASSTNSA